MKSVCELEVTQKGKRMSYTNPISLRDDILILEFFLWLKYYQEGDFYVIH